MDVDAIKAEIEKTSQRRKQNFGVGSSSNSIPLVGVAAKVIILKKITLGINY